MSDQTPFEQHLQLGVCLKVAEEFLESHYQTTNGDFLLANLMGPGSNLNEPASFWIFAESDNGWKPVPAAEIERKLQEHIERYGYEITAWQAENAPGPLPNPAQLEAGALKIIKTMTKRYGVPSSVPSSPLWGSGQGLLERAWMSYPRCYGLH